MSRSERETIISERVLFEGNVFSIRELEIRLDTGEIVHWEVAEKLGDSVAMVPVDKFGNVHLVEEYYGAVNRRLLSLPKGTVEANESVETAALRELQEEIGFTGTLRHMVSSEVSPSYLRQITHIYLVTDLRRSHLDGDERNYIATHVVPLSRVDDEILSGRVTEARTIAGLLLAKRILGDR